MACVSLLCFLVAAINSRSGYKNTAEVKTFQVDDLVREAKMVAQTQRNNNVKVLNLFQTDPAVFYVINGGNIVKFKNGALSRGTVYFDTELERITTAGKRDV